MNSDPNSDCKQCIESKLGWVHSAHTQNSGRAHTVSVEPRSWALLRAWKTSSVRMRLVKRAAAPAPVATQSPGRDTQFQQARSRPASALPIETRLSRPKTLVATLSHHKAARIMSRHQIGVATPLRPLQVATSKRGRDTVSHSQPQARSQHQNQVVTLLETNLCRDINFMSRPRFCPQWDF